MGKIKISGVLCGILIVSALAIFLTACQKATATGSPTPSVSTYVLLMDLAPFSPTTQIFINGAQASSAITPGNYNTTYSHLIPGTYDITFKTTSGDSVVADIPSSTYDSLNFYTVILYNADTIHKTSQALKIFDDFSQVSSLQTYFRFFDLCPGLPAADLYLNGNLVQQNRTSADIAGAGSQYTLFHGMPANAYNVQLKKAGTDSVLLTLGGANFSAGNAYTVFVSGAANNGSFPIALNVVQASY